MSAASVPLPVATRGGDDITEASSSPALVTQQPPHQPAPKSAPVSTAAPDPSDLDPETYERTHVHSVYEAIAPHFSATRYKPWPVVADFLRALPPGAVGLDVGCGNGKYLGVNPDVFLVGSDRSAALVTLARDHGRAVESSSAGTPALPPSSSEPHPKPRGTEVLVADGLSLPFRASAVDFAICIAVIHHMSTRERRREALRHLLDSVRKPSGAPGDVGGTVLVFVWALEQGSSRRGWEQGGDQDLLVPWVMKSQPQKKKAKGKGGAVSANKSPEAQAEVVSQQQEQPQEEQQQQQQQNEKTYQRYYHLYKEGELEDDVKAVGGQVLSHGYDRDNWWAVAANA